MEKIPFMFQAGIAMDFQLSGKLKNNIKKRKKIKTKYLLKILDKNVGNLQKVGSMYTLKSLND